MVVFIFLFFFVFFFLFVFMVVVLFLVLLFLMVLWWIVGVDGWCVKLVCVNWVLYLEFVVVEGLVWCFVLDIVVCVVVMGFNCVSFIWLIYFVINVMLVLLLLWWLLECLGMLEFVVGVSVNNFGFFDLFFIDVFWVCVFFLFSGVFKFVFSYCLSISIVGLIEILFFFLINFNFVLLLIKCGWFFL